MSTSKTPTETDLGTVFSGKRALVTGGLGFIGSNLARRLVDLEADVTIVDSMVPGHGGNPFNIADFVEQVTVSGADLRDRKSMENLLKGKHFVFNLAGQVSHIDSMTDPLTDLDINCRAHLTFLEALRAVNPNAKVVFAGTRQQYGRPRYLPVDETHPLDPVDVNGINKAAAEGYHLLYYRVYGLRTVSLRLTNTYGPGLLMKHPRQGFIAVFIRRALENQTIQLYGGGKQVRDLTYVDDVVAAFLMVAASDATEGQAFNLGGIQPYPLYRIAEAIIEAAGHGRLESVEFPEDKKRIDIGDYYGSYELIRRTVGWEPQTSLEDGIRKTVDFYKRNMKYYI